MPRASRDRRTTEEGSSSTPGASASKDERESSRQSGELASVRRMLVLSEGSFSLNFCV